MFLTIICLIEDNTQDVNFVLFFTIYFILNSPLNRNKEILKRDDRNTKINLLTFTIEMSAGLVSGWNVER